jgi:hypothetical protein
MSRRRHFPLLQPSFGLRTVTRADLSQWEKMGMSGVSERLRTPRVGARSSLVHFDESQMPQLSTNLGDIPYYAGRTVLRMWIAFTFSLLFTLTVGYAAAKNRTARAFILPARHASRFAPAHHRCAGRMAPRAAHRGLVARSPGGGGI